MTCETCGGRGWTRRPGIAPGGGDSDICLDCTDPKLLAGPPARRKLKPGWYDGKLQGDKQHRAEPTAGVHRKRRKGET